MKKKTTEEKAAFQLFKKHLCGRGLAWPVTSEFPDMAQAAILAGIEKGKLLADSSTRNRKALDALGLAITNAGYAWTHEMRSAYESFGFDGP